MPIGIVYALVAYSIYSCGDALVKGFGNSLSVFEIGFFVALFSLLPALFSKPAPERWRDTFVMRRPLLVHLRAFCGAAAAVLVTYAVVTIPFAETYALIFLSPVFITLLAMLWLKEGVSARRWLLLLIGFVGVMVVVRPGFRELQFGHLAAILCAFFAAAVTTILRQIANDEQRVTLIGVPALYVLVINAMLMVPTFTGPDLRQFGLLALSGSLIGVGHILLILATRNAAASQVAPIQYIQIVWAIALGMVFFGEIPDGFAYLGIALVVGSGLVNIMLDGPRARLAGRFAQYRARRNTKNPPVAEMQDPRL